MWPRGCSASVSGDGASGLWKGAEGVECAGAVRPERTVAVVEFAFALPALVSGANGGVSSGAAYGVNVAAAEEAVTPRWLPGGAPHEPSHCLQLPRHSLQRPQSCSLTRTVGRTVSVGPVQLACAGWTVVVATSAVTSRNLGAAIRSARSVVGASACSLP